MTNPSTASSEIARVAEWIRLACLIEATARKPGNVHPDASFADVTYNDFVASAEAIAPILAETPRLGVGLAILEAVKRTRASVGRNTNLGIILLLAPLAAVPLNIPLADGIAKVLNRLSRHDAVLVYQAIRTAGPRGLGQVSHEDILQEPRGTLLKVMRLAADRDFVAAQYASGFQQVLEFGVPILAAHERFADCWQQAVVDLHLRLMAKFPDTLIARKCGASEAQESTDLAQAVLDAGWPDTSASRTTFEELDNWLRAKGNRRNPGTTADLVTACLFTAFREGTVPAPPLERIQQQAYMS